MEVYAVFEDNYTDEFKAGLDEEYSGYQKNGEVITKEEMDRTIKKFCTESNI